MTARLQAAGRIDRQYAVDGGLAGQHCVAAFARRKKTQIFAGENLKSRERVMNFGEFDALGRRIRHLIGAARRDLRGRERSEDIALLQAYRSGALAHSR